MEDNNSINAYITNAQNVNGNYPCISGTMQEKTLGQGDSVFIEKKKSFLFINAHTESWIYLNSHILESNQKILFILNSDL